MSYLDRLRLTFFGDFQADVSTVNNDVRHYDNRTFEPRFQEPAQGAVENGWWRPAGSNAFRLLDCRVRGVHLPDGTATSDPAVDAAAALHIGGSTERVSGKLVDLDPQWQMMSQIWGLEVRLVDAGLTLMRSVFEPTAFRDIFVRQPGIPVNGQGRSSRFQSVLRSVAWASDDVLSRSPFLVALQAATAAGALSIRLTTFGYYTIASHPRFTLGTVVGVIGPARDDEPRSFIAGRRFAPQNGEATAEGVNFFDGRLDEDTSTALVDLSNAFPLVDPAGGQPNLGAVDLVALANDGIAEGQALASADFTLLAQDVPYREPQWLASTGGIHAATLTAEQAAAARDRPWALLVRRPAQPARVMIRETGGGFHLRADDFVQRLDAGSRTELELWATGWGRQLPGGEALLESPGPIPGLGGGRRQAPQQPTAPIPVINVPADALVFSPSVPFDERGRARVALQAGALGEPRQYLDGQIFLLGYRLAAAPELVQHGLEFIAVHVRSSYQPPAAPSWEIDVAPILLQFGNLYPVMGRLVDLTSYESVAAHRAVMELALALPIEDPNHMPVTRDLSEPKREAVLRWLTERDQDGRYVLRRASPAAVAAAAAVAERSPAAALAATAAETPLARRLAAAQRGKGQAQPDEN